MKKAIKAFTLVELIVSFVIISILSLVVFRTVLSIQAKQIKSVAYNSFITFQATINNAFQNDLTNKIVEGLDFCGRNCYDIKFAGESSKRISLDVDKKIISYDGLSERLPKNFSFYTDMTVTQENLSFIPEGEYNSFLTIRIPIDSKTLPGKHDLVYVYQFDDRKNAINTVITSIANFKYSSKEQKYIVPHDGKYQIEVWGAQGGNTSKASGGKGAYAKGTVSLKKGDILYLYVGGQDGYNGGGNPGTASESEDGAVGGGATDVRIGGSALVDRIIVAGGGGGASGSGGNNYNNTFFGSDGGYGGGGIGWSNGTPYDGPPVNSSFGAGGAAGGTGAGAGASTRMGDTTTVPGHVKGNNGGDGTLGQGGAGGSNYGAPVNTASYGPGSGGGGGGGYYGGGGGGGGAGYWGGPGGSGGGGSSYISTSGTYSFSSTLVRTGDNGFLSPNGTQETGHTGNGYIKLTYIEENTDGEEQYAYNYSYTGNMQTFTAPKTGNYEVQLWGASGSSVSTYAATIGKGGYTKGTIFLTEGTNLYFYVGGQGRSAGTSYNGGGAGESAGGGATDVRLIPRQKYRYVRDYINGNSANTENHWVEIEVYDEQNNKISVGKSVTGSIAANSTYVYSRVTNGTRDSAEYAYAGGVGLQWVEIDLGAEYEISKVIVMHYYTDGRTYSFPKTELYNTNRTEKKVLYDSAVSGTYAEVAGGKAFYESSNYLSRIMVAGGGGGGVYAGTATYEGNTPGHGGGLQGQSAYYNPGGAGYGYSGYGGTQTAGGAGGASGYITGQPGVFGHGGNTCAPSTGNFASSGGGGGYYGGGSGTHPGSTWTGGGGGSSFISGHAGCNAVNAAGAATGQPNHYSGKVFTNTLMIDGAGYQWTNVKGSQVRMPKPDETLYALGEGNSGNGYAKIKLLNSATCTLALSSAEVLVVAGGGGGGNNHGGGGGAGGLIYNASYSTNKQIYPVAVGLGGTAGLGSVGEVLGSGKTGGKGANSSFGSIVAIGGGGGGGRSVNNIISQASTGGSGGGGAGTLDGATGHAGLGKSGTSGQGNTGGDGTSDVTAGNGGGGGGAGAAGGNASGTGSGVGVSGTGGNGLQYAITGTSLYYAGGGSGGRWGSGSVGAAGLGGGGIGGNNNNIAGGNGTANTGGGGGGGGGNYANGGSGGSGVVIIRYAGTQKATGGTITSVGGYTIHTFTSNGIFTVNCTP